MLSLLADTIEISHDLSKKDDDDEINQIYKLIHSLNKSNTIVNKIGDIEIEYFISLALEATKEKILLTIYEKS